MKINWKDTDMGTSHSTVCCPVRLDDFVYETPVHHRTYVQVRARRKARKAPEGSPHTPEEPHIKSKVCRRLVFAKKRLTSSGVPHHWKPRYSVLNRMWCTTKRNRKNRKKNTFHKPIAELR